MSASLAWQVWDYDKAGGNDLLGEYVLEGTHFHKPGEEWHKVLLKCKRFRGLGFRV